MTVFKVQEVVAMILLMSAVMDPIIAIKKTSMKSTRTNTKQKPHILFILVDDLGWGDVGYHAQDSREVKTPNIDELVAVGIELNRHYVHSSCTGTRVALQSGRLPVHVQTQLKNPEDPTSGMPRNMTGIAEQMKSQGYKTHYVGKWDVGMATPKHIPKGRGYDTSLNYFEHQNDYWSQQCNWGQCCHDNVNCTDMYLTDLWDTDKPAKDLNGTDYEEFIFLRRMVEIIDHHGKEEPLFLFYAPHVAHCPLQVPKKYLDRFDFITNDEGKCRAKTPHIYRRGVPSPNFSCRKQYHAMVNLLDDIIGSLTKKMKKSGFWDDLLIIFTSDNGGPTDLSESGSTNFPLRGGKYTDFEGGVRSSAFVSGGFIPKERRGATIVNEPVHICNWYATLPKLAGLEKVEDKVAKQAGLPGIDAIDIWPLLSGTLDKSPREEIPLSKDGLLIGDYKLIWNPNIPRSGWTSSQYPNASSTDNDIENALLSCGTGCLFNVADDPGEHFDLAATQPVQLEYMKRRLVDLRKNFFENDDKGNDSCPSHIGDLPCACWAAINFYGGFLGPYQEVQRMASAKVEDFDAWHRNHIERLI